MKTLRLYGAGLLVALLLALTACVPSTRGSGGGGGSPDFTLSLRPASLTVQQGSSGTTQLTVTPQGGFTGTASLSLVGAPSGVSLSLTRITGSNPVILDLTISVDRGVAPGTYNLQVKVTGEGITRTAALSLTVTAPDAGTTWTLRTSGGNDLNSATYGKGLLVAVGWDGTILTSPDGVSWTRRTSGTSNWLLGVTYGNGTFVAVGEGGTILTSRDGVSWTQRTSGSNHLLGVAHGNSLFVAVGEDGTILTSPDGVSWTQQTSPVSKRTSPVTKILNGVTYGNGTFVAVGRRGAILTSP